MTDELASSLATGPHAVLGALVGDWAGLTRTWFRPGDLADESATAGTVRPVLAGRFVVHEYAGTLMDEAMEGVATLGFDIAENRFVCAWVDSVHTGTAVMLSVGEPGATDTISVLGAYDAGDGSQWGWRTTVVQPSHDELVVSHFNIPAGADEYLGVETRYRRVD
ncbi:MAG: DUF1579 domain-containing protein [Thermoleophilia bacterium]|nr:DUF1579 domain-containing protein [Thermoleophilia bacterium]MDH4340856.1 DUF1579 domain-containing protein [Thermoleophilia bacterium]MDH5281327.1 DUF1579 domain-containing protein [Thermoleophilia bacterium]